MARRPLPSGTQARIKRRQASKAKRIQAVQAQKQKAAAARKKKAAAKRVVKTASVKKPVVRKTASKGGGGLSRYR